MISKFYRKVMPKILGESKKQIRLSIILFVLGVILGYIVVRDTTNIQSLLIQPMQEKFGLLTGESMTNFGVLSSIFTNNLKVALLMLVTGWFFGILPTFTILFNGLIIGIMVKYISLVVLIAPFKTILTLLPHGILEIPALVLTCALAMRTGGMFFDAIRKVKPFVDFKKSMVEMVTSMVFLIIPAFLIAAVIETFVSSQLASAIFAGSVL